MLKFLARSKKSPWPADLHVVRRALKDIHHARRDLVVRRALKDLHVARCELVVRRDKSTQQVLLGLDPAEASRLSASSCCHAGYQLCDPDSLASAILAIHQARGGGTDAIWDTAAALVSATAAAAAGEGAYQYFEKLNSRFPKLCPDANLFMMLASPELRLTVDRSRPPCAIPVPLKPCPFHLAARPRRGWHRSQRSSGCHCPRRPPIACSATAVLDRGDAAIIILGGGTAPIHVMLYGACLSDHPLMSTGWYRTNAQYIVSN
jgi:hypothetical protein